MPITDIGTGGDPFPDFRLPIITTPDNSPERVIEPGRLIDIRAEIAPCITFATHQCDVAVVADLILSNRGPDMLEGLTLHLWVEPRVIGDRVWTIDRIAAGSELRPQDRRVTLAGGMLDTLTERMRAEIRFELRQGDRVLAESRYPVVALARNEWGGARTMPELLAAFVMPNDPAIQSLLKEASELLQRAGKSGSIEGYQSKSRKRSWEIVSGIWAAVCRRGLTYVEPPASFGINGQKIRLPSMIEAHGLATCLDTALLFAAAIEQAGLYPVVVFTEGHAMAGAWLQPQSLPTLTVDDPMQIRKAVDLSELVLFETTMATAGHAMPFARAVAEGRRQIGEANEHAFIYAIDIRQARGRDIQPLSSSAPADGHGAAAADASRAAPPLDEAPDLPPFDSEAAPDEPAAATPEERLDRWKRSLLDLSKRNRLLNLKPSATAIPIFCPDPAKLEDRIAGGKRISIITPPPRRTATGEVDPTLYHLRTGEDLDRKFAEEALERNEVVANVETKVLEKGAIELYRKAKTDFEEGGSNTLFLALGMLRWSPPGTAAGSKASYRAPMVMLPVRLERASAASKPKLARHEDDPIFNLTLLQMLRKDFDIDLSDLERELPVDATGVDVRRVWEMVRARIRDVPGFEVVEDAVLSTFSFAKYLMWKDLADRTAQLKTAPFVRHVIDTPRDPYAGGAAFLDPRRIDREIDPTEIIAPLNADSSQIVAIHASGGAGDYVLEGPPGTGKSETIGNIIAHNIAKGRRVLFVSEKMAALDVVYSRLEKCGLGDFCLELHSAKANKRAVIDQLGAAWQKRAAHPAAKWRKKAENLGAMRHRLNGLVEALHAPGPGGMSPRDAVGRSLRYADVHRLRLGWGHDPSGVGRAPSCEAFAALEDIAKRLGQQFAQVQPEDIAAFASVAPTDWSFSWQAEIVAEAHSLDSAISELVARRRAFAAHLPLEDAGGDPEESEAMAAVAALVPECAALDLRFALEADGKATTETLAAAGAMLSAYRQKRKAIARAYPDDRFSNSPIEAWIAERARASRRFWPFSALARRRLRRAIRSELGLDTTIACPEEDLDTLLELAAIRDAIDDLTAGLSAQTPWRGLKTDYAVLVQAVHTGHRLREAATRLASFGRDLLETRSLLARALCDGRDRLEAGMPIASSGRAFALVHADFAERLRRFRALSGLEGHEETEADLDVLAATAVAIVERERRLNVWCAWVEVAREAREAGLGALVPALETARSPMTRPWRPCARPTPAGWRRS